MNILIVDDEKEIADLVEVYLKNEGFSVTKAYSGSEASACIEKEDFDLPFLYFGGGPCICNHPGSDP